MRRELASHLRIEAGEAARGGKGIKRPWPPLPAQSRTADPDLRDKLYRAIDELPEIYRVTFIMHDVEGYTHDEIATALGIAEGTCKSRLSVARAQLREKLASVAKEWME